MREGHRTVVRIVLLDEHMAVETSHLRNTEDTYAAEGACRYVENLALSDIRAELTLAVALQTVEGDRTCRDVAFQRATCEVRVASLKETVLDKLIFDGTVSAHLAAWRVSAVEAHEGVGDVVFVAILLDDILVIDILRCGVIDVEEGNGIARKRRCRYTPTERHRYRPHSLQGCHGCTDGC